MIILQNFIYFLVGIFVNLVLVYLFSINFYIFYFLVLSISLYLFKEYCHDFSYTIFFLLCALTLGIVNTNLYDEYLFEVTLYFDLLNRSVYMDGEVSYILLIIHISLLIFICNKYKDLA